MSRRNEAGRYLLDGLTPQQISDRMNISLASIRQYLCMLVGEGELLHSDIAFNVAERHLIEDAISNGVRSDPTGPYATFQMADRIGAALAKQGHKIHRDLVHLYLIARDPRSDLYRLICEVELLLHRFVRQTLEAEWWQKGVPEATRKSCQIKREEDSNPLDDPYHYTTIIDLKSIIDKNWLIFAAALPKPLASNKQDLLQKLLGLNEVRNRVMHPVKPIMAYEDDYKFVRKLLATFSSATDDRAAVN
jgi:hypothetical protein